MEYSTTDLSKLFVDGENIYKDMDAIICGRTRSSLFVGRPTVDKWTRFSLIKKMQASVFFLDDEFLPLSEQDTSKIVELYKTLPLIPDVFVEVDYILFEFRRRNHKKIQLHPLLCVPIQKS